MFEAVFSGTPFANYIMIEITRKPYDFDLNDIQWDAIAPLFEHLRNLKWPKRELRNAVFDGVNQIMIVASILHTNLHEQKTNMPQM